MKTKSTIMLGAGIVSLACASFISILASAPTRGQTSNEKIQDLHLRSVELLKSLSKHGEAQALAQETLNIAERASGRESAVVAQRLDYLAFTIRIQHRYDEAEPLLIRAFAIREKLFGGESPDLCQSLTKIAVLYELKGDLDAAQRSLSRCLSLRERAFGADHPTVGHTLHMLSKLYRQAGRREEAKELTSRALQILGPEHPAILIAAYESGQRQRDRTFFGQMSDYHWTGLRADLDDTPQRMTLLGEATFNNGLWNLFEVRLVRQDGTWKASSILSVPVHWRLRPSLPQ